MPRPDHKSNLTGAAIALFRKQGFAATGLNQIILASGAPKGSLYHYFPGGKEELGATAVRVAGSAVADDLREIAAQAVSFADFLSRYPHMVAGRLTESGFQEGCPTATVLRRSPAGRAEHNNDEQERT